MLHVLFTKCLILAYFLKPWKIAQIIFFHKQNTNPLDTKAYRPICLLSMLGKVYERILKNSLTYSIETKISCFRMGTSTTKLKQKITYVTNKK